MKENSINRPLKLFAAALVAMLMAAFMTFAASAESGYVNTSYTGLNLRSGAGTTYSIITTLAKGSTFEIISEYNGWTKVSVGNLTGYVSSTYVGKYSTTYSKITLSVPYYTQYDSRWASITLGGSDSTIRSIGCTTTCFAMSESYRTGTTVTPENVAYTYSYTSGGALYWPTNYIRYTEPDWLSFTYSQLAAGKPVIIHCQKTSGTSHWVIIYGYTGGSTLTASNFLIHDPASTARTTLAQYLAVYPNYVKLVYYTY
jgi:Uncharacterized protein with a bacterial SH3 domain homologue